MNKKSYNYVTLTILANGYKIHDNILNQELCSIKRSDFVPYFNHNTIFKTAQFISDLEEISYRLQQLMNDYFKDTCSCVAYLKYSQQIIYEIEARFNHYFPVEDMPMVAQLITDISNTTRKDDSVYEYFVENCERFIQNKTKQKLYFDSQNPNSFDDAISNYA